MSIKIPAPTSTPILNVSNTFKSAVQQVTSMPIVNKNYQDYVKDHSESNTHNDQRKTTNPSQNSH